MAFERVQLEKGIRLVGEDRQNIGSWIAPVLGAMRLDNLSVIWTPSTTLSAG